MREIDSKLIKLNFWKGDYNKMIKNLQAVNWTEQFDGKSAEDTWIHVQSEQFGLTSVGVKATSRMETFAMSQHVERQRHFDAFALLLNSLQRSLQAKPETDLLQRCTRRRVTVQLRHLNQVQQHARCHRLHYKSIFQQLFGTDCTGANRLCLLHLLTMHSRGHFQRIKKTKNPQN